MVEIGREAIEKYYADRIQKGHFSNFVIKYYPDSIRALGTAGNEMWAAGEWSITDSDILTYLSTLWFPYKSLNKLREQ